MSYMVSRYSTSNRKKWNLLIGFIIILFGAGFVFFLQSATSSKLVGTGKFDSSLLKKPQSFINIKGNQFVNERNEVVIFRGVNIADPDKILNDGHWNKKLFEELKRWGVNVIRVPVHPSAWRNRGEAEYIKLLDQAVIWANEFQIYLVIDWHSIGQLYKGRFQDPMYHTSEEETFYFWHRMAFHYQNIPTIAFFEFFNEPTTLTEDWNDSDWMKWKILNEQMIDEVRAFNKRVNFLVAGFNWAYDLIPVQSNPIDRPQVAYVSHPYPQKENPEPATTENFHLLWEKKWGFAAKKYPVFCTELGWSKPGQVGYGVPVGNDGSYGPQITEYMEARGISYAVWAFDPDWLPLIKSWNYAPTEQGIYFKKEFLKNH